MNGLDLFSGIGGLTLALEPWVRPIAYCESDRWAQALLLSRMSNGQLPRAAIWDDVQTLRGCTIPRVDIIYGGFPCQDISSAGRGAGLEGKRSGLFFEIIRLVEETRPRFVFLENVPAIRTRGLQQVIQAFTDLRYDCRWTCVSAAEIGAPHLRRRWFLLASDSHRDGQHDESVNAEVAEASEPLAYPEGVGFKSVRDDGHAPIQYAHGTQDFNHGGGEEPMADANGEPWNSGQQSSPFEASWWAAKSDLVRVAHGVPMRVDRLRGLGNAVVPAQARVAFQRLLGIEGE